MTFRTYLALVLGTLSCKAAPTLEAIKHNLVKWEGYRLTPYRDPISRDWCVGVGHNLTAHRQGRKTSYTPLEVERMLMKDISSSIDACRAAIDGFDRLPDEVQLVCLNLAFTAGRNGLMRFTSLRRALGYRAFNSAATELRLSRWYTQVSPTRARWAYDTLSNQP